MKNDKLNRVLVSLGLSQNEAKVYLAALSLGSSTPTAIARAADIKRTTAYSVIESLKQQGLINEELRGLKTLYVAENPEKLQSVLETKQRKLIDSLPELSSLFNLHGSESLIKYYEGLESVKSVYESLLVDIEPHEDYLVMGNMDIWHKLDPDYFQDFLERRSKLPINIRLILEDTPFAREHQKLQRNYSEAIKLFPPGQTFRLNVVMTPRRIAFHQLVPPIRSIVIENKFLIETQQQIFNLLWDTLP